MQIKLQLSIAQWFIRYVQSGSKTGWSEWEPLDRFAALRYIETGYPYETEM